jgi:hypothetical protein
MSGRRQLIRLAAIVLFSFGMGIVNALMRVDGSNLFSSLSQAVAPWLLLAFLAGAYANEHRLRIGAFSGLAATMAALIGFYFTNGAIFHYGPQSWPGYLTYGFGQGKVFFTLGLLSGPSLGAFGAWWRQNLSLVPVLTVGMLFIIEGLTHASQTNFFAPDATQVAAIEVLLGLVWIAVALVTTRSWRQRVDVHTT